MIRARALLRLPRFLLWLTLLSMAGTFVALLGGGPDHRLGGPVLYFAALSVCGALLVLSIVLLLVRRRGAD